MRYIRYAFLAALGIVLVSVSMANRDSVTLKLIPDDLAGLIGFNWTMTLPLFVVVLGGIAVGLVVGFLWEWLREHKHRRDANKSGKEVRKLEREVTKLKDQKNQGKDEVLAILDEAS